MNNAIVVLIVMVTLMIIPLWASETSKPQIHVFHKQKAPSLKALGKIKEVLASFPDKYSVLYCDIEDEANLEQIQSFGLPSTHFPIAVVIDGKFTVVRDDRIISFVHFPLFMKGIGRHEGNWDISDLEAAIKDPSIFFETNILPELEKEETEGECE